MVYLTDKKKSVEFRVSSIKDILKVIIPHLDNLPLITKKWSYYMLFKLIVLLMAAVLRSLHLTSEGLQEVVNIRASINTGLTDTLKKAFPLTKPIDRPVLENKEDISP